MNGLCMHAASSNARVMGSIPRKCMIICLKCTGIDFRLKASALQYKNVKLNIYIRLFNMYLSK